MTSDRPSGPVAEPRQERALQTRQALLASARELFRTRGYNLTTAKDIAASAGVAVGSFYRYFIDKKQVLLELVQQHLETALPPQPEGPLPDPETAIDRLLSQDQAEGGLLRAVIALAQQDPAAADLAAEARRQVHLRLLQRLQDAAALGRVWPDLDLDTLAWSVHTIVDRLHEESDLCHDPVRRRQLARIIARMIFVPEA